ncbi:MULTISPECIES: 16S rRNA (uracil(1498)-N(3))-methyltransferase [unclassified Streptococcus]|uniref:16S rRNA (uracil(1498)-N(3))-methyltransferase n=1 Tax=unclassified Streptococcus TaxID=2608887 RepID=UPI001071BD1A|nr:MULTISPECIES: 16S rRNA (uracil(1498)-N(3))-methyltransferase [unclassified Streptococcus]MBF0787565.1 16S rRNA (uracil(1498)-N(3))-methyltransferase [Streptococcus sp. 19428wC2_LYSM12]MCQ9211410.1 16S rRNA (uracil(1498)-N(3))-methyltransferase [Streptococcus sp. B01]MCQ9214723.1 16S rRNA (uracil(1498)-N(3))-methyltransferase [Streptococcus sp. O1]TFV05514.1 16S rRNA (uracil(1498)-N(3))-methyltransferase [Streptococcus sp. LYSM12]
MQQYFVKGSAGRNLVIEDKDTIKHMFQVMRLAKDDQVILVFDDGIKRLARVVDEKEYRFEVMEKLPDQVELPVDITIACGFPKGDKLEFLVQKTTELGASQFWAFPADWSVVKWDDKKIIKKTEKLQKTALGAAEQSKRNRVPDVSLFASKSDFLGALDQFDTVFIAYEESAKVGECSTLVEVLSNLRGSEKILFIFGPEGGLSPAEVIQFETKGGYKIGLGPRIMRAETAPLYALASVSVLKELM